MRLALPKGLRFAILERDGFRCRACGQSPLKQEGIVLHVDHIFPVAKGGTNHPSNLQTLCEDCNSGKLNGSRPMRHPAMVRKALQMIILEQRGVVTAKLVERMEVKE